MEKPWKHMRTSMKQMEFSGKSTVAFFLGKSAVMLVSFPASNHPKSPHLDSP
jgi:hypothetical protein